MAFSEHLRQQTALPTKEVTVAIEAAAVTEAEQLRQRVQAFLAERKAAATATGGQV